MPKTAPGKKFEKTSLKTLQWSHCSFMYAVLNFLNKEHLQGDLEDGLSARSPNWIIVPLVLKINVLPTTHPRVLLLTAD